VHVHAFDLGDLAADRRLGRSRHQAELGDLQDELRFLFITSELSLVPASSEPAIGGEIAKVEGMDVHVEARPSEAAKCVRCWHYREDVGQHADHPELCGRCVDNVDGAGEQRLFF
jgi:isoleucyl-tRNA synthetase